MKEINKKIREALLEGEPIEGAGTEQLWPGSTNNPLISTSPSLSTEQDGFEPDEIIEGQVRQKSRRSFLIGGLAILGSFGGWRWLTTRREDDGIIWPLRRALEVNEQLSRDYFGSSRLAATFPPDMAREPRVNGDEGMDEDFDPATWNLQVIGLADIQAALRANLDSASDASRARSDSDEDDSSDTESEGSDTLSLTLSDIKALPRAEVVTELKCIEGWSVVVQWAGARFVDFAAKYMPATRSGRAPDVLNKPQDLVGYVSIETPDGGYYVGLDMASALHLQTLLCYEMNGKPLTLEHGAPLRLIIPVKYGIKNIKRIGTIRFTDKRPADFWAARGYDWYAGH